MNDKRVAIELCTAGWFHLKNIRKHLHLLECSLRHILIHVKSLGEDIDYVKSVMETMTRRLDLVIQNSGNPNKF